MYRFVFLFFLVFLFSCDRKKKSKDFPEITVNKFHDVLFSIDSSNVSNKISELHVQDSFFLDFYVNEVLYTDKNLLDTAKSERVEDFLIQYSQNKFRREVYDSICKVFGDFDSMQKDIDKLFANYRSLLPKSNLQVGKITTCYTNFMFDIGETSYQNNKIDLLVSLESFLGSESKFYSPIGFPQYRKFHMSKHYLLPSLMVYWFERNFIAKNLNNRSTVLDMIIYEGKKLYFLNLMFPDLEMHTKFLFKKNELDYIQKYEFDLWNELKEKELLYEQYSNKYKNFFNLENQDDLMKSPTKFGSFIGYKIVESYMKNNEVDLYTMLNSQQSSSDFLMNSKYQPSNKEQSSFFNFESITSYKLILIISLIILLLLGLYYRLKKNKI
tara:strand:+ start:1122 stop:2270 length:1149 start_codon:yes stop_codon:yes gene_type:complete